LRLFVTGLGGYLGRAIAAAAPDGAVVGGTVRDRPAPAGTRGLRVDVRDERAIAAALDDARPDAVIHTAYVQGGPDERSVNVDGAATVARAAATRGIRLVHLSSDLVFAGDGGRPVREDDDLAPTTEYGATKADGERAVAALHPGAVLVRTSLVYGGAQPSNHELRALDPEMTFYADEIRCPVAAPDLAAACIELAGRDDVSGPLHVAGADAVSRLEFARLVAATHGRDPDAVRGGPHPPARPGDITLDCSRARALLRTRLRGVREVLGPARPPIAVRPAAAAEFAAIADVCEAAYAPFVAAGSRYREVLRDVARRAAEAELLVAADPVDGRVLGTVTFVPDGGPLGEIAGPDETEFRMLAVDPAAQGRGVGAALVRHVVDDSRARGRAQVVCSSQSEMRAAHRVYERAGFRRAPGRDWSPAPGVDLLAFVRPLRSR
jgi:dTDP-4-dehydrorhamnose reductase